MNTTELIEIARECGAYTVEDGVVTSVIFGEDELQQFAQRIEQPLQARITEIKVKSYNGLNDKNRQIEQLREDLEDALRYKRADEKLVDIINGMGQQQQKPKHGRQA